MSESEFLLEVENLDIEYRQIGAPETVSQQTAKPDNKSWTVFQIRGEEFLKAGVVSAWRVSLWDESNNLLAERKSALW